MNGNWEFAENLIAQFNDDKKGRDTRQDLIYKPPPHYEAHEQVETDIMTSESVKREQRAIESEKQKGKL